MAICEFCDYEHNRNWVVNEHQLTCLSTYSLSLFYTDLGLISSEFYQILLDFFQICFVSGSQYRHALALFNATCLKCGQDFYSHILLRNADFAGRFQVAAKAERSFKKWGTPRGPKGAMTERNFHMHFHCHTPALELPRLVRLRALECRLAHHRIHVHGHEYGSSPGRKMPKDLSIIIKLIVRKPL